MRFLRPSNYDGPGLMPRLFCALPPPCFLIGSQRKSLDTLTQANEIRASRVSNLSVKMAS
jgi:hypothetical protein